MMLKTACILYTQVGMGGSENGTILKWPHPIMAGKTMVLDTV